MSLSRRAFIAGLFAAPAIVRASSLMPIRAPKLVMGVDMASSIHDEMVMGVLLPGEYVTTLEQIDMMMGQIWMDFKIQPNVMVIAPTVIRQYLNETAGYEPTSEGDPGSRLEPYGRGRLSRKRPEGCNGLLASSEDDSNRNLLLRVRQPGADYDAAEIRQPCISGEGTRREGEDT